MLFNSYVFIFIFLPVTTLVFFAIGGRGHHRVASAWLVLTSLVFYGWWNPKYVALIMASICFNYAAGVMLSAEGRNNKKLILAVAIAANLALLGYYKYANFFVDNLNALAHTGLTLEAIILPIGISFFTFTQTAFLVDAYKGEAREYNFLHYCLFVTYFPHLVAGPILHHKEMMPQFAKASTYRPSSPDFAVGLTLFSFGLFKKVMFADEIARYSTPVFAAASSGAAVGFAEAWCGALAFTFQLYFDFSAYSDMALGLGRIFSIKLPINFHSPYKAENIIEFWRRWHITLSRFLRDYLYIPLGGNRKGKFRRYLNLLVTMLLGGLWHGAGWTFIIWGALHGIYLALNHAFRAFRASVLGHDLSKSSITGRAAGRAVTFIAVVIAWVFFRAEDFSTAIAMLKGMAFMNGFMPAADVVTSKEIQLLALLFIIAMWAPNSQEMLKKHEAGLNTYKNTIEEPRLKLLSWSPTLTWAIIAAILAAVSILSMTKLSEFLYFRF
ncbi:MAG: MBOAT family protein [Deltaproteobacteria bacterium]|nr:MBOAT family protein [Deltaproteobacteria bacterium]